MSMLRNMLCFNNLKTQKVKSKHVEIFVILKNAIGFVTLCKFETVQWKDAGAE